MRSRVLVLAGSTALVVALAVVINQRGGSTAKPAKLAAIQQLAPSQGAGASRGGATRTASRTAGPPVQISSRPIAAPAQFNGDVRSIAPVAVTPLTVRLEQAEPLPANKGLSTTPPVAPTITGPSMPAATTFAGLDHATWGAGYPPDTTGDVGPNNFVQAVNSSIGIYSKAGSQQAAMTFNTLWSGAGTGTPCDTSNQGDPTVVYDPNADRWFLADFSWSNLNTGPYYECIAVSKTGDPVAGGWYLYAIRADDALRPYLPDYPKMGIWPDGLYMGVNMFCEAVPTASCPGAASYQGVRCYAFDRVAMEAGGSATVIIADLSTSYFTALPANLRGAAPPAGRDEMFVSEDQIVFGWDVFKFHPNYVTPGSSTFTGPTLVSQTAYNFAQPYTSPSSANLLDVLVDRNMNQVQYRNLGGTESLWVNHTVRTGSTASPYGIQWGQINVTGGTAAGAPVQQQIYGSPNFNNDGIHRFMGSLAVDKNGDMALGYTASNTGMNPDIRYNGRLVGDPGGTLPQTEGTLQTGGGSQNNVCGTSTCTRWGDYSEMTIDPDGCTFWYTNEYYAASGNNWQTRIGSFKFPSCSIPTAAAVTRFATTRVQGGVAVVWRTGTEAAILGFNVFRDGSRLNSKLVPAKRSGQARGAAYRFLDRTARRGSFHTYRLQIVDLKAGRTWYEVGSAPAVR